MAESRRDEIAKLEALYASNPDGRVFTHLAEAYRRAGELDRAREILDRGLQRHPDYPSAHVVLGRVYADLGRGDDAATSFRRVLELDPENLIARRSLAEAARAAGHDQDALLHYRELLAQDTSAAEVRDIVDELEARLHGPAAPPPVMPSSWNTSQDEESWESREPAAPLAGGMDFGGYNQGTSTPDTPAFGDIDLGDTFGQATPEPSEQAQSPFDPVPLDLSGVDFGGPSATPEATPETESQQESAAVDETPGEAEPEPAAFDEVRGEAEPEPAVFDVRTEAEPAPAAFDGTPSEAEHEPAALDEARSEVEQEPAALDEAPSEAEQEPFAEPVSAVDPEEVEAQAAGPTYTGEPEPFAGRPTVEAPLEHDERPAPQAPSSRDEFDAYGVPTETLAALYQAQGFPDRAAVVYRALLRDRPDDERLRERARAADEAAAALRAQRTGIEETREVWVSGTTDSWDRAAQPRTAYAWDDAEEDDEGVAEGPSIGEYLRRVLSWRPSSAVAEAAVGEDAAEPVAWDEAEPAALEPDEALPERWEAADDEDTSGEHDTLDGFVFGGEPADTASGSGASMEIEYGYGLAPGESAFGSHPPEEGTAPADAAAAGDADESAADEYATGTDDAAGPLVFGDAPQAAEDLPSTASVGDSGLHLDTLLPLPPEDDVEEEQPATWFEPEPAHGAAEGGDEPHADAAGRLPFDFAEADVEPEVPTAKPLPFAFEELEAEPQAPTAEPLPFDFEQIGTEPESPAAEPLPFDLSALGAEVDDAPGEPLPFELYEPDASPDEPSAAEADEALLELEETEAVNEVPEPAPGEWDPTIALADVAPRPHARPEARLRVEGGSPPEPAAAQRPASHDEDEGEDEDLEMFRSWLQSLKR